MFASILYPNEPPPDAETRLEPACFRDLNLDQVVTSVTAGRGDYRLTPFCYGPLTDTNSIAYRHEVFRDLTDPAVAGHVEAFATGMRRMRDHLATATKLHYPLQKQRWFAEAAAEYCRTVTALADALGEVDLGSRGLAGMRDYLADYVGSERFTALVSDISTLADALSHITYCLHIKGNRVRVRRYEGEDDYSQEVLAAFERFRQGAAKDYRAQMHISADMNHVEAGILDLIAKLFAAEFAGLASFCDGHGEYLDDTVARFDREIQFYLAYLGYIRPLEAAGLPFCYPQVVGDAKTVHASDTFDLALASKLTADGGRVVTNDLSLGKGERILVVTGPNQGGKTTVARTFGQLHYLARLGCPVPGREARLFLCDEVFTHFEREEDLATLSGKLRDDLVRFQDVLTRATSRSVIVMNEIFSSTSLEDALFLGKEMLARILGLGALGVCVTFLDELASLDPACVSMVATVAPGNPLARTFKVVRKPADGLAYATALAAQHGLTYPRLKQRLAS